MTREQIIAALKEAGFDVWVESVGPLPSWIERFYTIAFNDGFRSFSDELCEKCGKTRQHAGGGCIHCITEWCKEKVQKANTDKILLRKALMYAELCVDPILHPQELNFITKVLEETE